MGSYNDGILLIVRQVDRFSLSDIYELEYCSRNFVCLFVYFVYFVIV